MKNILILILLFGSIPCIAQSIEKQVIGSTGGTFSGTSITLTSTVGESVITTSSSGSFILTQGYQQAIDSNAASIEEETVVVNYNIYPNPTTNEANLEITTLNLSATAIIMTYAKNGKLINKQELSLVSGVKSNVSINLKDETKGVYFIKIFDSKFNLSKTLRVVKM